MRLHALGPWMISGPRMIERILGRTVQGDEIATEEFLTILLERIQMTVLAQASIFTVKHIANMVDRLVSVPVTRGTFSVAQSHQPHQEDDTLPMSTLHRQTALLTSLNERMIAEVGHLKKTYRGHQCGSRMNVARSERRRMFRGLHDEGVCWCRAAWGYNARKYVNGCSQSGKWPRGSLVACTELPLISSCLLTIIQNPVSRLIYLIDTSAEISVMPPCPKDRSHAPDDVQLQAAKGSSIQTFG